MKGKCGRDRRSNPGKRKLNLVVNENRTACVASPALVEATFWLGTLAVVSRVLPLILPPSLVEALPWSASIAQTAYAFSGMLGLGAVLCLWVNLWKTAVG